MGQLGWPQILSVALRVRACEAVLDMGRAVEDYSTDPACEKVFELFQDVAKLELNVGSRKYRSVQQARAEGGAIDAYLKRVHVGLNAKGPTLGSHSELSRAYYQTLLSAFQANVCEGCSPQKVCPWTRLSGEADSRRVSSTGSCLDPINQLFAWSVKVGERAYRDAGVTSLMPSPELHTSHGDRCAALDLAVRAETFPGRHPKSPRRIELAFNAQSFWLRDRLSLPYVLSHECVAHGFCGIDVRRGAERSSAYHEGWMDCVAAEVFRQALDAADAPRFASAMWSQTEAVRALRFNPASSQHNLDVGDWLTGKSAFETLWWLFTQVQDASSDEAARAATSSPQAHGFSSTDWKRAGIESLKSMVRFSLRLNASHVTHAKRADFVAAITRCYSRNDMGKQVDALSKHPQILDYIQEYDALHHDESEFVKRVTALR